MVRGRGTERVQRYEDDRVLVAFVVRRPWPEAAGYGAEAIARDAAARQKRWAVRGPFWCVAGRGLYWPPLVTVWHREARFLAPVTACEDGRWWRWHLQHWYVQAHPVQALREWLTERREAVR